MKESLVIEPQVLVRLAALAASQQDECWRAIAQLPQTFGRPHVHSGIGIRKLMHRAYEFRGNLDLRFIFVEESDALYVCLLGSHDEVRKALRSGKYG